VIANEALARSRQISRRLFADRPTLDRSGSTLGAMLLQAFYSVRSERQLMERLDTDLLFRWFVVLGVDDTVGCLILTARAVSEPIESAGIPKSAEF
jgi:hypothetical protein